MADNVRRSGRKRKANPRYVVNLVDVDDDDLDNVNILSSGSDVSEFEQNDDEEIQDLDLDEDIDEDINEESSIASEDEEDEAIAVETRKLHVSRRDISTSRLVSFDTSIIPNETPSKTPKRIKKPRPTKPQSDAPRSRGYLFNPFIKNKHIAMHEIAGNDDFFVDLLKREQNKYVRTVILPFREDFDLGRSGLAYPEVYSESIRDSEGRDFLSWYEENEAWQTMVQGQATKPCAAEDQKLYIDTKLPPQDILLGPYDGQQHFTLDCLKSISVTKAWQTAISAVADSNDYDTDASDRPAWILNTGSRILSMDWAPNQDGAFQYLAVSVGNDKLTDKSTTPFEPVDPYEASIQIWAFPTRPQGDKKLPDMNEEPKLAHVICAKWGTIRRLSWCPAGVSIARNTSSIGILGLVSTDGFVRVVDVCVSEDVYVLYDAAAFVSKPPDTIFTCLTWLSASQIAAGCGNGYVAIWDIGQHLSTTRNSPTDSSPAIPTWYHGLHTTYVMSVIAHQPYPCQYITTNAVDGRVRLVSIRNPYADTAYGARARQMMPPLCASPHVLGFFEIDDADGVRARSVRHIPFSRSVGKANAQVTCMDVGKAHPCLLFGGADGSVVITNPLPRIFLRRLTNNKIAGWQQTWFRHEFVPSTRLQPQPTNYASSLQVDSAARSHVHPRQGFTRFLESFKMDKITPARNMQPNKDNKTGEADVEQEPTISETQPSAGGNDEIQISIYEEEQAVTCLSWNANISAGGWAAAGMANGLLRVEDLAI